MLTHIRRLISVIHPSAFLLLAQLIMLVFYALFDGLPGQRALLSASGVAILLLRLWVVDRTPGPDWIAWVLAAPALLTSLLSGVILHTPLLILSALLEAALYFYAAGSLIAYMMKDTTVTTDELFAAGATFTLIAWGFAYLYLVNQTLAPGSLVSTLAPARGLSFLELLFLSFTNLSSAGLSDIVPVTPVARVLVMLEQFAGVGYVAMVVSRLVGLTIQLKGERRG